MMLALLLICSTADDDLLAKAMQDAAQSEIQAVKPATQVNGYVMNRLTLSWVAIDALTATPQLPQLQNLMEANVQLRRPLWTDAFAQIDASIFLQQGGWFVQRGADGSRQSAPATDNLTLRPRFVPSELFVSYSPHPNLNITVGRRRIVWGPGFANNPTDVLNPPRDPSDPNLQRSGAYVLRLEVPTEHMTFSLLASPQVLYTDAGLPYQFLRYPEYPPNAGTDLRDSQFHYLLAGRVYLLVLDSDINLIYYYSNLYGDAFANKSRIGLTFSRYFFTDYELHIEALLTEGTQRNYVDEAALTFGQTKLNSSQIYPRLLVGSRRVFSDESQLSLEYLWVGDGYTPSEFQSVVRGIAFAKQLGANTSAATAGSAQNGLITRFSFDPLRRHYLFLSYTKPKIGNDWTVGATLVAGLEDLSGVFIPNVTWNTLEWLNLQVGGFVPIRFIPVGQVEANGNKYSEYGLFPYDFRVYVEARAFY